MPGSYAILPAHRLVYSRAWGVLSTGVLLEHARTLAADGRFGASFAQVADLRDVVDVILTPDGVRRHAEANPFGAGARRAVVASSDLVYGMARMYEMLRRRDLDTFQVFRDLRSAVEWIGLDVPVDWDVTLVFPPDRVFEDAQA